MLITVALPGFLFAGPVLADDESTGAVHPFLTDKYNIQLGVFSPKKDIGIRVDGTASLPNDEIDFDEAFNTGASDSRFEVEMTWRFREKWSMRVQHFGGSVEGSAVLKNDAEWREIVIPAGSSVTAGAGLNITRIFAGRAFDSLPQHDYGVGFGLHWLDISAFLSADVLTASGTSSAASASGPLPNVGGWYYYSPSPKWYVGGRLDWIQATVGIFSGGITNLSVGANYQLSDHFGLGAKYQDLNFRLDIDKNTWHGRLDSGYTGAFVYVSANW